MNTVTIAPTAIIHPNVVLGENIIIEDYCIIGSPFKGYSGETTYIGDDSIIRSHTVIYAGNKIGKGFQTGNKANIRELNTIGNDVSVGTHSILEHHILIEDGVRIHSQVFVPEFCIIKKNAWLGPNCVLTNAKYPRSPNVKKFLVGVTIQENAKIGANCTVLPGISVGKNSLVGAGSVVTKNVPDGSIVKGNPAKFLRSIDYE
ncbi:DapH/DapD/GlmU-related protein [Leptospira noguchii]|uniref:Transferase hexapeptide repeat protein n=1 Tax=Leptospira noguchii TaxID=28182 RepID=M6VVI2_9LEPT|nr:DapH/DapD/GlmU-related protein [Leptospira noguchii]EMO53548.1 transferase hexapeptide repeat protein [Leptospira noguchii]